MDIRPLHTSEDHAWALSELTRLWEKAEPGTPDGARFEVLSTLVDAYERKHVPLPAPDPIAAIRFRLDQMGASLRSLQPIFKTTARTSEIMNRKRKLNLTMIRALHRTLSIPVEVLVQDYPLQAERPGKSAVSSSGRAGVGAAVAATLPRGSTKKAPPRGERESKEAKSKPPRARSRTIRSRSASARP